MLWCCIAFDRYDRAVGKWQRLHVPDNIDSGEHLGIDVDEPRRYRSSRPSNKRLCTIALR
jgi:hypothetical protein